MEDLRGAASASEDEAAARRLATVEALFRVAAIFSAVTVIPGLWLVYLAALAGGPALSADNFMGAVIGALGLLVGLPLVTIGGASFVLQIAASRWCAGRRRRRLCLGVAAWSLLAVPVGTVIGVWALVVLTRPPVADLFDD